ncbi:MAG TPA: NAD(+) synthase [Bacilli bacterium]|nr:NAD(+) synthase [Bacilli bacterium]
MKLEQYLDIIKQFIADKLTQTNLKGYVLGLSGGIDSALVAALCAKAVPGKLLTLIMPCDSHEDDLHDATAVANHFDIPYQVVDLTPSYHVLLKDLEATAEASGAPLDDLARHNLKVRLRMVTLYAFAQARRSLVLGTDNWDESYTGYFTKYGDGAVDLLPIIELTKGEVYEAARLLGVPHQVIDRPPSAGLFPGQTDEGEMGVKYADLDAFLLGKKVANDVVERIKRLHTMSAHKRDPIPRPTPFIRS